MFRVWGSLFRRLGYTCRYAISRTHDSNRCIVPIFHSRDYQFFVLDGAETGLPDALVSTVPVVWDNSGPCFHHHTTFFMRIGLLEALVGTCTAAVPVVWDIQSPISHILPDFILIILSLWIVIESIGSRVAERLTTLCAETGLPSAQCLWSETTLGPVSTTTQLFFLVVDGAADRITGGIISSQHTPVFVIWDNSQPYFHPSFLLHQ